MGVGPESVGPTRVSRTLGHLTPGTTYHYRLTIRDGTEQASVRGTFTTRPGPNVKLVGVYPGRIRNAPGARPARIWVRAASSGTLRVVVEKVTHGRRVAGRCRPGTPSSRRARAALCVLRARAVRTISRPVQAGPVSVALPGRGLIPGAYRISVKVLVPGSRILPARADLTVAAVRR